MGDGGVRESQGLSVFGKENSMEFFGFIFAVIVFIIFVGIFIRLGDIRNLLKEIKDSLKKA